MTLTKEERRLIAAEEVQELLDMFVTRLDRNDEAAEALIKTICWAFVQYLRGAKVDPQALARILGKAATE